MNLKKTLSREFRLNVMYSLSFLPDELYIRLFFFVVTGRHLNLKNPKTFEDKQQWLKLNDKHYEYRDLVDKLKVREHIIELLGKEYLFPIYGAWRSFDAIDFSELPKQFVLKCNHDSGSVKIIKDKDSLSTKDIKSLKKHFETHLKRDYFYDGREYPYRGITPYIIAEKYMIDDTRKSSCLNDYKFLCFHGVPKVVLVVSDRTSDCKYDFFDMDFKPLSLTYGPKSDSTSPEKPVFFNKMIEISRKLSEGKKFVRIDLYEVDGKIYFGEYTFFDGGGFQWLTPDEWEYRLGSWIDLGNN